MNESPEPDVANLISTLRQGSPEEQQAAVVALEKHAQAGHGEAIAALLEALSYAGTYLDEIASEALLRIGALSVLPLIALLKDRTAPAGQRFMAARTLVYTLDPRGIDPVLDVLGDRTEDPQLRRPLPLYAKRTQDERVSALLRGIAHDPEEDIMLRISAGRFNPEPEKARWSHEELLAMLDRAEGTVRVQVRAELIRERDPRSLDLFVPLLYSDSVEARLQAGDALYGLGERAWEPLMAALQDSRPETRMAAIPGLIGSGHRAVEPLLQVFTHDPSPAVRGHAAAALGVIGGEGLADALLSALERELPEALPGIIAALRDLGDTRAIPTLRLLSTNPPTAPDRLRGQIQQGARRTIERLEGGP